MDKGKKDQLDAGLRNLDHYRRRLPPWRHWLRQKLLPLVRYETPYLAWFQERIRTPALDSYFALSANLGTHTFFMIFLPMLFWFGYTSLGRAMIHVLASGVFFSGFVKDLLCLPRPLSPPLQRITMSGSAALEYGFPSTHSTNAVSVAMYALALLNSAECTLSSHVNILLQVATYLYVGSIVIGRLYCGMHGFFDVIIGCLLGALITWVQYVYGDRFDQFIVSGNGHQLGLVVLIILVLIRVHPEPADDCPCFDDSVAFAAVMIGAEVGYWHFARSSISWTDPSPATVPYRLESVGWLKTVFRVVLGVLLIVAWREVMKPSLLRILPPIFRSLEKVGLILPRRFFTRASQYTKVPSQFKDHDVLPNVSEVPSIWTTMRHPRRRAISIGPQSEADVYETLAYREKRRRESLSLANGAATSTAADHESEKTRTDASGRPAIISRVSAKLDEYEHMMGAWSPQATPTKPIADGTSTGTGDVPPSPPLPSAPRSDAADATEMFSMIKKPRVRYDVEVVTKLIVYTGIAWIAVEGGPILFDLVGLGVMT